MSIFLRNGKNAAFPKGGGFPRVTLSDLVTYGKSRYLSKP